MRFVLDTHSFLWFGFGDTRLSPLARTLIADPANEPVLSVASLWEMAIKVSTGKLQLTRPYPIWVADQLSQQNAVLLHVELDDTVVVAELPYHHRDPFDRMLVAQALVRHLPIVSADTVFDSYGVARLW